MYLIRGGGVCVWVVCGCRCRGAHMRLCAVCGGAPCAYVKKKNRCFVNLGRLREHATGARVWCIVVVHPCERRLVVLCVSACNGVRDSTQRYVVHGDTPLHPVLVNTRSGEGAPKQSYAMAISKASTKQKYETGDQGAKHRKTMPSMATTPVTPHTRGYSTGTRTVYCCSHQHVPPPR